MSVGKGEKRAGKREMGAGLNWGATKRRNKVSEKRGGGWDEKGSD